VNFTGIDSPHELPERHEVTIDTTKCRLETAAEMLVTQLRRMRVLGPPFAGGA
jgi:adenylylsulfate kinase-like enzyme